MTEPPFIPFDEDNGLILATTLPGSASELDTERRGWDELSAPHDGPPLWVHLDRTRQRAQQWLREQSGVDPLVAQSLLDEETRPRTQAFGEGLLVMLRGLNMNPGADPDELITIRMWFEPRRVITLRQYRFQTIAEMRRRAQRGEAPATPGEFLAAVAEGLAQRLSPTVLNLEEMMDDIEDEMLEQDTDNPRRRSQLATFRRQSIGYRRFLVPQRDVLHTLSTNESALLSQRDRTVVRVAAEQTSRICDALEEIRDRAAVTQDEMRARHEARINRTLYLLTIVATVALPLGLITGLLGINVGGIPLAESSWGFTAICVLLAVLAAAEITFFRLMRWL